MISIKNSAIIRKCEILPKYFARILKPTTNVLELKWIKLNLKTAYSLESRHRTASSDARCLEKFNPEASLNNKSAYEI